MDHIILDILVQIDDRKIAAKVYNDYVSNGYKLDVPPTDQKNNGRHLPFECSHIADNSSLDALSNFYHGADRPTTAVI